jgi:cell division protein FtsW
MEERINNLLKGDRIIWGIILALTIYSLLAVYSSIGTLAYKNMGGNTGYYIIRHAVILGIGIFIIYITHLVPYRFFSRLSQLFLYLSIPLLLLTLIIGTNLNQAARWLTLPVIGLTIQPSDFAKLALIMFLARMLSLKQTEIRNVRESFRPLVIPVVLVCILILPANLSTSLIVFVTAMILLFIGRVPMKYLLAFSGVGIVALSLFIGGALLLNKEGRISTWKNRIENFVQEDSKESYQVEQAKIAVSTGKFFGKRPGKSMQRNFLPHPYSDFIFAIIIEEYGLIFGAIPLILIYLILLYRAGLMVKKANRTFPAFLAIGLALLIVFQAFVNMAVAVSLFPVTGQTLPFVSMGGSSLLFTSVAFGMILSVSRGIQKDFENEQQQTT